MFPEMSLKGKTAIVTGAGRGIGREIALVLAEAGANVALASRTEKELEATATDVRTFGREAIVIPTDVSKSSEVDSLINKALEHFDSIEILVNNAGQLLRLPVVPLPDDPLKPPQVTRETVSPTSDQEWQGIIEANLNSVFYCCRSVASHMMEKGYGKIINIGSNNATQAFPWVAAYNSSKAAVNMLTRVLALEWAPYNILVNAIGPGDYHTRMTAPTWIDSEGRQRHLDGIPLNREGELRELGILAAYLACHASDYMTGQIIYMDGGLTAK